MRIFFEIFYQLIYIKRILNLKKTLFTSNWANEIKSKNLRIKQIKF